jgi:hypothetical protein
MIYIASPNRTPALVSLGKARILRSAGEIEQGKVLAAKVLEGNDAQYDYWMSLVTTAQSYEPEAGSFVASSPNRPKALFDAGVFRELNAEEAANVGNFTNRIYSFNDRQWDLARTIAINGIAAPFPITIPEVKFDYDALAQKIVANLPEEVAIDVNAIAKAVRAEFATNPLK